MRSGNRKTEIRCQNSVIPESNVCRRRWPRKTKARGTRLADMLKSNFSANSVSFSHFKALKGGKNVKKTF